MPDLDIKKIGNDILARIETIDSKSQEANFGRVIYSGDGILKINGLTHVKSNELLEAENGVMALALNLERDEVGAIVLGDEDSISTGMIVKATGRIVEVPVGEGMLSRVVDPLGRPIDGQGEIRAQQFRPIESPAPGITDRSKVDTPLQTGILAIDAMIPIGRGQRELIIGDRQTGKTAIAVDTILNQRGKGVICVYVAIGQKASTVAGILHHLSERGAMEYTVLVCSTARDSAPLQYLAPYTGCAIAEHFMEQGRDVLIVYDDLSKHAVAYRAISLLLKRPPGREAYPGDVFYLHSRLLERAAKLSEARGGGSMTAIPIVETLAGDISAYIPTNVISITDGQIYLESELFNSGIRPAVNVGLSVSRVGGSAQIPAVRKLSGKLRIDLAQYRELAVFAQFGSDLDKSTRDILEYGRMVTELLKQEQYRTMDVAEMCLLLYAVSNGMFSGIPVGKVKAFRDAYLDYVHTSQADLLKKVVAADSISEEIGAQIGESVAKFKAFFLGEAKPDAEEGAGEGGEGGQDV